MRPGNRFQAALPLILNWPIGGDGRSDRAASEAIDDWWPRMPTRPQLQPTRADGSRMSRPCALMAHYFGLSASVAGSPRGR